MAAEVARNNSIHSQDRAPRSRSEGGGGQAGKIAQVRLEQFSDNGVRAVAAFAIVVTLIMMIMEKSSDIAIMKAMGKLWGEKVSSKLMYEMFPLMPSKQGGKVAGLPESRRKGGY